MEELIEKYKERLSELVKELVMLTDNGNDPEKHKWLNTKAGCYRTFISEMESEIKMMHQWSIYLSP